MISWTYDRPPARPCRLLTAEKFRRAGLGHSTLRAEAAPARFAVGDAVRTTNVHPRSHTRLPRYCRDQPGTIARVHGAHVFPDANALGQGEKPQWLYTVRFAAADLWGPDTTAAAVYVDCWEPYLK